jgi:hypothetical protein
VAGLVATAADVVGRLGGGAGAAAGLLIVAGAGPRIDGETVRTDSGACEIEGATGNAGGVVGVAATSEDEEVDVEAATGPTCEGRGVGDEGSVLR